MKHNFLLNLKMNMIVNICILPIFFFLMTMTLILWINWSRYGIHLWESNNTIRLGKNLLHTLSKPLIILFNEDTTLIMVTGTKGQVIQFFFIVLTTSEGYDTIFSLFWRKKWRVMYSVHITTGRYEILNFNDDRHYI
jgi:hypothetical protein